MAKQTINTNSVQPLGLPNTGVSTEQGDTWDNAMAKVNAMFTELYNVVVSGAKSFVAGLGTAVFGASGNISTQVGVIGSSATNTTQTLASYVLPASTLAIAGNGIMVTAWGQKAANAAPCTLALNIGGMTINSGAISASGSSWMSEGIYFKSAASAQVGNLNQVFGNTVSKTVSGTDTSVDTGTINISVTMLDASAGQSNILLDGLIVEFFN
jgi:hypothetical protein